MALTSGSNHFIAHFPAFLKKPGTSSFMRQRSDCVTELP
ncbi:hypothetical protein ACCUM_3115 [Candidatus Accumulibacter phosphatis]|uniref:Uncharacterized protein n=1 Tax=Candidatus Accumulibacter phosphatis TaxID=327160 RepID=A0A5S4EHJ0_9PROT|nr:hypothetical protein ACCUM_3115 [Candidatus Accumulibacter phosphatis]